MLEILLVEDNPADIEFTRDVLAEWDVGHRLVVAMDGEEGLARLLEDEEPPDLVLLDLNLPRLPGVEVLRRVREEERLRDVVVVVLATSEAERDVVESQRLEADGYLSKPISLPELEFAYFRLVARKERR